MIVVHPLEPVYDKDSKVLILGSIPSVKSREIGFYYMHPKNRFWKVLSLVYQEEIGIDVESKKEFLHKHHVALFDVVKSCDINSSSDNSIKDIVVNDFREILSTGKIEKVFCTGRKSYELYNKYCYEDTKVEAIYLPSTSPANCRKGIEEVLVKEYSKIRDYTG